MNNFEYYKNKTQSEVIRYLKEYELYHGGNFNSEDIKLLICTIVKDIKSDRKEILEKVLKELIEGYWFDKVYEFDDYLKYDNHFILKNINIINLLYYSIGCNNFKIAKILLKNGVQIKNKVQIKNNDNNIIEYLIYKKKLNIENLHFILKIVKDASLCTIKSLSMLAHTMVNKYDLYKEIFQYKYYDVKYILNLLIIYKQKITFSDKNLQEYIYNNNNSLIKVNDITKFDMSLFYFTITSGNSTDNRKNHYRYTRLLIEYANYNKIILDINRYPDSYEDVFGAAMRIGNMDLYNIVVDYANKNNIILNVNNKCTNKHSPLSNLIVFKGNIEMLKKYIEYAEEKNILINLNVFCIGNIIIKGILTYSRIEILDIIIEYAIKHNIIIQVNKSNMYTLKEYEKKEKYEEIIAQFNKYKSQFKFIDNWL